MGSTPKGPPPLANLANHLASFQPESKHMESLRIPASGASTASMVSNHSEGDYGAPKTHRARIGVFTSGGDSQAMSGQPLQPPQTAPVPIPAVPPTPEVVPPTPPTPGPPMEAPLAPAQPAAPAAPQPAVAPVQPAPAPAQGTPPPAPQGPTPPSSGPNAPPAQGAPPPAQGAPPPHPHPPLHPTQSEEDDKLGRLEDVTIDPTLVEEDQTIRYMASRRRESVVKVRGREGEVHAPKSIKGRKLGIFTSGGDSQGMNSAVRSVVRMGLYLGCKVYLIKEGYQGMVDGSEYIVEANWNSVSDIIQKGGTIIGSARCKDFREREGRLKAAENLLKNKITNLVCIGGDGSLTGANLFRQEWPSLIKELLETKRVEQSVVDKCRNIQIVGMVGSIDNDFCGTDMTIGTDTALHRIIEAIDAVVSTAQSHQRAFVIEVMGRHCGYLALVAALASEADWVFIPEWPASKDWETSLCDKLSHSRNQGQRLNIIIVAEGAIDQEGNAIPADKVRTVVKTRLGFDTRTTVLGHVQRGGSPSAFDRLLGCRMGAEAVLALMEMTSESEPCVISIDGNQMVRVPLMQCVQRTQQVQAAMAAKNWAEALKLRGRSFARNLETYKLLTQIQPPTPAAGLRQRVAVVCVGAPAGGMNAAVRAAVRVGLYHNCRVFGIQDSFEGLTSADGVRELSWSDVNGWAMAGGSFLGTQKVLPTEKTMAAMAKAFEELELDSMLIIGGFEAYHSALLLYENRDRFPQFQIPITVIPCTISNNVPGTSFSLGSDTALNEICYMIDKIKLSATGTKRRVFIVETMGGKCGYLATLSALASGADNAYIYEEPFNVASVLDDVKVIAAKMDKGVQRYLIIRNEHANQHLTTKCIEQIFSDEGKGKFTTRTNVLGHAQQGGCPSPFDRNVATKQAARAMEHLIALMKRPDGGKGGKEMVTLLGLQGRYVTFTPVADIKEETNFPDRLPNDQWWLRLRPLLRILAKHDSTYEVSAVETADEPGTMNVD